MVEVSARALDEAQLLALIFEWLIRELIRTPSLFLKTQLDACG